MVIRAVRAELEKPEFADRFRFEVYDLRSDRGAWAEVRYPFGRDRHGFVVVDASGDVRACRPGHFYGAPEIEADLAGVLTEGWGHLPATPSR